MYCAPNGQFLAWIAAVVLLACSHDQPSVTGPSLEQVMSGSGLLVGRVTVGPLPPGRGRPPSPGPVPGGSPAPVVGATIVISEPGGGAARSAVTDARGEYAISLAAGTYRVTMDIPPNLGFTKDLPAIVTITAGKETRLDIRIDTGIR